MLNAQRRQIILDRLKIDGQVSVAKLSLEWGISEDSVRRDLRDLAEEGLVQRVHGGALPASPALGDYQRRLSLSTEVKSRLGRTAASLIRSGMVVAIDGGTSTLQLVQALPRDIACTVITHSPLIAAALGNHSAIDVIVIGGRLFRHSQVAVGSETTTAIGRIRTDAFFLGATGLHPEAGATTGDWEEGAVKRAFCHASAETILMVSPEKLGAASTYQIVGSSEISTLIVDQETPEVALEPYRALGLTILRA